MSECYRYIFLKNEKLKPSKEFKDEFLLRGSALYEVIRIISGKPIFLEDHFHRLSNSAIQIKEHIWYTFKQIKDQIEKLIQINDVQTGNIKLIFHIDGTDKNFFAYFIQHHYPQTKQYLNGIRTIVHHAERPMPNAKVYNHSLRSKTNDIIREAEIFEVLLLNSAGNLTEGSRSNLFFIKNNELHTANDSEVLNGIVRSKILEIAEYLQIPIRKSFIKYDDLAKFDAAFLTGTSLMILPIKRINSISYSPSHEIIKSLSERFTEIVNDYLH